MAPDKKGRRGGSTRNASKERLRVVSLADPGPPYIVRWHPDAEAERDASWPTSEKVAMAHCVEKLQAVGPRLKFPHSSAVQGAEGKGLRELRPRSGRSRWRPIYRQVAPDTFVILAVGPEAGIDQRGFDGGVKRAAQRLSELDPT